MEQKFSDHTLNDADADAGSPGSPLREPEPTDWLEDFAYYEENEDPGSASSVFPLREPKPPRPQDESDYDDDGESIISSARNSSLKEIQPAQPQQVSDHNDNEPVNNSAPNSPSKESEQDEFEYDDEDDDTNDSAFPESPSREAKMAAEQAKADAEKREAELAQPSTSRNRTITPPADRERLRLYGASIYCAIIGSPERLSEYQELQLELTDRERRQRIEDIVDERNPCRCPTNTFDLCTEKNPYMESIVNKLRKMPKCLHYRAYRDVLVYFKYLRRKHRKMLLRNSPINNISC